MQFSTQVPQENVIPESIFPTNCFCWNDRFFRTFRAAEVRMRKSGRAKPGAALDHDEFPSRSNPTFWDHALVFHPNSRGDRMVLAVAVAADRGAVVQPEGNTADLRIDAEPD
ncbi:hypothetical protein [Mesorhizobium sp. M0091]|uniref:hypothetical protein n=1 Tax=Mesorhizobium sp. M0091 TaxID=2956875 RepID=UPI0033361B63